MNELVSWPLCVLYVFVVCVISNQGTNKIPHDVLDLSKFDTLLYITRKVFLVLWYQGTKVRHV